uniref:Uncharacterized protein n=1 Tax=Arundo donax TaxID=35708 RepID=A0A0A8ZLV3_ARUDO
MGLGQVTAADPTQLCQLPVILHSSNSF